MTNTVIYAEKLSKQYHIGGVRASYKTFREALVEMAQAPVRRLLSVVRGQASTEHTEPIWALRDVSFEVKQGEAVGIIGRNGAGKTTLLKILSRITRPTAGYAEIRGRVGSLLEVGTGFHPELTGRENIFLNGAILGMRRNEIKRKFDDIVAFAEIEKFIDTPVKHYSSGMYVRLAFAVAAHLEPEILLVDEVLAVGDAAFQRKCLGKMSSVAGEGRTVLFVSHDMAAVQSLCSRVLLIEGGQIAADGAPLAVIGRYTSQVQAGNGIFDLTQHPRAGGNGRVRIEQVRVVDGNLRPTAAVPMGSKIGFEIDYRATVPLDRVEFVIGVYNSLLQRVSQLSSAQAGFFVTQDVKQGTIRCIIPNPNFTSGRYYLNFAVAGFGRHESYDLVTQAAMFEVVEADVFGTGKIPDPVGGPCFFRTEWSNGH